MCHAHRARFSLLDSRHSTLLTATATATAAAAAAAATAIAMSPGISAARCWLLCLASYASGSYGFVVSDSTSTPRRLPALLADARGGDNANDGHGGTSTCSKSDEELLAEKLASLSNSNQSLMPWLGQSSNINTVEGEPSSPWFAELGPKGDNNLPFECTGCGNCCKTRGDVYMSPTETKNAAALLGLSISEFKEQFVEEEEVTVAMSLDPEQIPEGETGWTVLRHKQEDGSCIFLNDEGMCNIYEARPVQMFHVSVLAKNNGQQRRLE